MKRMQPDVAGFEDGRLEPVTKGCQQLLEAGKEKRRFSPRAFRSMVALPTP